MHNKMINDGENNFNFEEWKYYKRGIVPTPPPPFLPQMSKNGRKRLFAKYPDALFVRWYSDYDCEDKTNWWYVIKDTPYSIDDLKAKRRYEITKGRRFFDVKRISSVEYAEQLCDIHIVCQNGYAARDRVEIDRASTINWLNKLDDESHVSLYGAFFRDTGKLCGYALIARQEPAIHLSSMKTDPSFEKYALNAAIVDKVLEDHNEDIKNGLYVSDGWRIVMHDTNFQDYLEKYFGFRKAYCRLHVTYRGCLELAVRIMYPFRSLFKKLDSHSFFHKINGILKMEEYKEKFNWKRD